MNKKTKLVIVILIVIIISGSAIIAGLIKGGFDFQNLSGSIDNVATKCLESTLSDNGNLSVSEAVPISDEKGMKTDPYVYTIENKCKRDVEYFVVLNAMKGTNIDNLSKIKVYLTGPTIIGPVMENTLMEVQNVDNSGQDTLKSYKLDEGTLKVGEKKSFELRTWIDHDVTNIEGEVINKISIKQFFTPQKSG